MLTGYDNIRIERARNGLTVRYDLVYTDGEIEYDSSVFRDDVDGIFDFLCELISMLRYDEKYNFSINITEAGNGDSG